MKWFRLSGYITLFAALILSITACEETVDPDDNDNNLLPPTNLMVSSRDQNTLRVTWTAPTTLPDHYVVEVWNGTTAVDDFTVADDLTTATINNLTAGTVYTIRVYSANASNVKSTTFASVQWAPSYIYTNDVNNQELRLYSFANSSQPSGLNIYDGNPNPVVGGPQRLMASNRADWDLAFNDEGGRAIIAIPQYIYPGQSFNSTTQITEDVVYRNVADLASALDNLNYESGTPLPAFTSQFIDLKDAFYLQGTGNLVFVVRTKLNAANLWNYAKIMVYRDTSDNDFVFGSGSSSYVKLAIAYQPTPGVPYAKIK